VSQRRATLSFAHHKEVAKLAPAQQRLVLARAEREHWSRQLVREEAYRLTQTVAHPRRLTLDPGLHHGNCHGILDPLPDKSPSHLTVRTTLSWAKNNWGVGDLEGNYGEQHELVILADNGLRRFNGRWDDTVLRFDRIGTNQLRHPTQKPVALLGHIISKLSRE